MNQITKKITYSFEELRAMVVKIDRKNGERSKPILIFDGKPVHEIIDPQALPGEVFRDGKIYHGEYSFGVKASNLGRIMHQGEIISQREQEGKIGYLELYKERSGLTGKLVYQIIADIWLDKPENPEAYIRHHISNNGFDNRPDNLVWVTKKEDVEIHKGNNW